MNIREISKPVTAKALNESLARRFGQRIALEKFTLEQLQDVRNKIRTKLSQVETNESFDAVNTSEVYQKNKLFLDVLNAEISERENIAEKAKPDFLDMDKDGNKKEPMKKAVADKKKKPVKEGAEDQAELVMAAKDMVDRLTGWMEDTAEMQTESMLELADAIRDEMGQEQSDSFVNAVKPALEALYQAMETTRQALTSGVGQLTGEAQPMDDMGAEPGAEEPAMEPTVDQEGGDDLGDEFAAAEPAAGGEEEAGREKRESVERKLREGDYSAKKVAGKVLKKMRTKESTDSRNLAVILSKKK
jgi:hypothetical protein